MGHIHLQNEQQQEAFAVWVQVFMLANEIGLAQALDALDDLGKKLGKDGLIFWQQLAARQEE